MGQPGLERRVHPLGGVGDPEPEVIPQRHHRGVQPGLGRRPVVEDRVLEQAEPAQETVVAGHHRPEAERLPCRDQPDGHEPRALGEAQPLRPPQQVDVPQPGAPHDVPGRPACSVGDREQRAPDPGKDDHQVAEIHRRLPHEARTRQRIVVHGNRLNDVYAARKPVALPTWGAGFTTACSSGGSAECGVPGDVAARSRSSRHRSDGQPSDLPAAEDKFEGELSRHASGLLDARGSRLSRSTAQIDDAR